MFFRGIISALSILALVQSGLAEESDADVVFYPVFQLEPIIVGEEGQPLDRLALPASVTLLGREGIQKASAQLSLNESLQTVPGVFTLNPFNFAQDSRIAIRGFGARADFGIRGIRLIVDGIPATLPDGQGGVDGIDLGSAEEIEIIRGPAAAIYGPASGGVIRIKTEGAPATPFTEIRLLGGSDGLFRTQFKAGTSEGPWNFLVSASHLNFEGYRANSQIENRMINARIQRNFEDGSEMVAVVNAIDYPVQDDPGGLTLAEFKSDPRQARARNLQYDGGEAVREQKLGFTYRRRVLDLGSLGLHAFVVNRDFANRLPFMDGGQVSFERLYGGTGFRYAFHGEDLRWVAGSELGRQMDLRRNYDNLDGDRGPLALDQDENVSNWGSFLAGEWVLREAVRLSAALRYDELRFDVEDDFLADGDDSGGQTFRETSPMLGFLWQPTPEFSFFANWTRSFETPTTTELDNPVGGGFNSGLESQSAETSELGFRARLPDLAWRPELELSLFSTDVEDALVPFELPAFPGREFYRNAGSIRKDGLEAVFTVAPLERLSAMLSYTYSAFRYEDFVSGGDDFSGNRLPGIPESFANFRLRYADPSGISLVWNTRVVGSLEADDSNSTEVSGYSVSDLRISWVRERGQWSLELFSGVNNLFDKSYPANIRINAFGGRYYEPAPERNGYAGIRLRRWFGESCRFTK